MAWYSLDVHIDAFMSMLVFIHVWFALQIKLLLLFMSEQTSGINTLGNCLLNLCVFNTDVQHVIVITLDDGKADVTSRTKLLTELGFRLSQHALRLATDGSSWLTAFWERAWQQPTSPDHNCPKLECFSAVILQKFAPSMSEILSTTILRPHSFHV